MLAVFWGLEAPRPRRLVYRVLKTKDIAPRLQGKEVSRHVSCMDSCEALQAQGSGRQLHATVHMRCMAIMCIPDLVSAQLPPLITIANGNDWPQVHLFWPDDNKWYRGLVDEVRTQCYLTTRRDRGNVPGLGSKPI